MSTPSDRLAYKPACRYARACSLSLHRDLTSAALYSRHQERRRFEAHTRHFGRRVCALPGRDVVFGMYATGQSIQAMRYGIARPGNPGICDQSLSKCFNAIRANAFPVHCASFLPRLIALSQQCFLCNAKPGSCSLLDEHNRLILARCAHHGDIVLYAHFCLPT